jgi:hypothetical protein
MHRTENMKCYEKFGDMVGSCEHGKELSSYIKGGEFVDQLRDYQLLEKYFAPPGHSSSIHSIAT